ncbi:MAG: DUF2889 domain-containing protein [Thermoplasmata archaeon]|nr:MAG: DUF2889 domain-containing protein [Thermoplasmata archaeon]
MKTVEILERNINIQTKRLESGNMLVKSSILDLHHSMFFEMEIDIDTREIKSVRADMIKVPYPECKGALVNIQKMVGLRLERGLAKKMAEILGKSTGCTHMLEIAITGARAASYTILNILAEGKRWKEIMATDEARYEVVISYLDDSCIVFKK